MELFLTTLYRSSEIVFKISLVKNIFDNLLSVGNVRRCINSSNAATTRDVQIHVLGSVPLEMSIASSI